MSDKKEQAETRRADARWGSLVMKQGFVIIPSTLFVAQRRLGISVNEFNALLQIISFWWDGGRHPFPSRPTLAQRMDVSVKTVQRSLASLEKKGLLQRITRVGKHGRQANAYDLSGLANALKPIAGEHSRLKVARQRLDQKTK